MIYQTGTDIRIEPVDISIAPDGVIEFTADIEGRDGWQLVSHAVADVVLEARPAGELAWVDIETTPIDLSPWNGVRKPFEFRLTDARADETYRLREIRVRCEPA